MQAGRLDQRITIKHKTVVRDTLGAETVTWEQLVCVWANVMPAAGREFLQASQLQAEHMTRIIVRHLPTVAETMRVYHKTDVYDITSVAHPHTDRRSTELMCRRLDPDG